MSEKRSIRIKKSSLRRAMRIGCIPLAVIGPLAVVGLLIGLFLRRAPTWVSNPQQYLAEERFLVGVVVLVICQLAAHWLLGLLAASGGARAAGDGVDPRPRLKVIRRRLLIPTLALFALRIVLLIWGGGAAAQIYYRRDLLLPDFPGMLVSTIRRSPTATILTLVVLTLFAVYWLVGPFLRTRSSTALGALGAALAPDRKRRRPAAISARLGVGLAQLLLIAWGGGLMVLIASAFVHPGYSSSQPPTAYSGLILPEWRWYVRNWLTYLALGAGIIFAAGLQIVMAWVYRWAVPLALWLRRRGEAPGPSQHQDEKLAG